MNTKVHHDLPAKSKRAVRLQYLREYAKRIYRANAEKRKLGLAAGKCDCGNPATKWKSGSFICPRCCEIERQMYNDFNRPPTQYVRQCYSPFRIHCAV